MVFHPPGPASAGGPIFRDFFEEIDMCIEKEAQPWSEVVHGQTSLDGRFDVRESVGQREGKFLCCC